MGVKNIFNIGDNEKNIAQLTRLAKEKKLVPFIGAGFSRDACPTWDGFLDRFYEGIRGEFLEPKDEADYLKLKNSNDHNRFETMADLLLKASGRRKFEEEMKDNFSKELTQGMEKKFNLLHRAFPALKITTNFDCLIEDNPYASRVSVCYGYQEENLQRLFTDSQQNALLKIHGCLQNIRSIILSSEHYNNMYGTPGDFDPQRPLPRFLRRVFSNSSVLFIGCSLVKDRIITIMEDLEDIRKHFAIMLRPNEKKELVELNRRLSDANIYPIWITNFDQIEDILAWLVDEPPPPPPIDPGVPFVGREEELKQIRKNLESGSRSSTGSVQMITGRLFSIQGAGGVGKTTLALEAARQFSNLFKDGVLKPIRVDEHTPMSFAVHLAKQFGLKKEDPLDEEAAQGLVTAILKDRQVLVILDNAVEWQSLKYMLPVQTASALLVTTRNREIYDHLRLEFSRLHVHEIPLEKFTPGEARALFKRMLGNKYRTGDEKIYEEIAQNLGFLPIALRQAISLLLFGPKYPAGELLDKLRGEDRLDLLRKGQAVEQSDSRTIESIFDLSSPLLDGGLVETLQYLAICAPGPVPLDFLKGLAQDETIAERLEHLHSFSWCERRELEDRRYYELHQLVRELMRHRYGKPFQEEFVSRVHDIYMDEAVHFSVKDVLMPQLEEAFTAAAAKRDKRLIKWFDNLYDFFTYRGHIHFYLRLSETLEVLFSGDKSILRLVYGNQALIRRRWGELEEAMQLHQIEETICKELADKAGLARSYGYQALIHHDWGNFAEAMCLQQKKEIICEKLADRKELATCYGNQGLIFRDLGNLNKAMWLLQKQEIICSELGDEDGLSRSYGYQAEILQRRNKLDEAMQLLQNQETICRKRGNKPGLAACYGNQAVILEDLGKQDEAMRLFEKVEEIFTELSDRAELATCYGNQALILRDRGKLDEAMHLHLKEETICKELSDRAGLAICYWNQGLIYQQKQDSHMQAQLWQKSIELNKSMGIPTEEDEKELAELLNKTGK